MLLKYRRKAGGKDGTRVDNRGTFGPDVDDNDIKERTLFVGNVSVPPDAKSLRRLFIKHGKASVSSVRIRSVARSNPKMPKRSAVLAGAFHPDRLSCNAYVVMANVEAAERARVALHGTVWQDRHLRVDFVSEKATVGPGKNDTSVFVGNLALTADEEDVRAFFSVCGVIDDVRIVRDKDSGMGKGFAFVRFTTRDSVPNALALHEAVLGERKLRVFKAADKPKTPRSTKQEGRHN